MNPSPPRFESLTILLPMWNEEDYIGRTVRAARTVGEDLVARGVLGDYEILIVDDASTDTTGALADALAAADDHVRVLHHERNRRLGGSIKTGLANAKGEIVLYTDADLPFDLGELFKAFRLLDLYEADIVSAYRLDRTSEGPRRAVYSWMYNGMLRWTYGIRLRDINFAFKLIRHRVLDHVQLSSEGSFIDAELLLRAQRLGFSVVQFGVDYFPRTRGVSTLSSAPVILKILKEMRQLRRDLHHIQPLPAEVLALPRLDP